VTKASCVLQGTEGHNIEGIVVFEAVDGKTRVTGNHIFHNALIHSV
jgi:hypothetical protein